MLRADFANVVAAGNGLLAEELLSGGYRLCREVAVQSWTLSAGANPLTSAEEECAGRRGAEEEACVRALITELAAAAQDSARIRKTFATRSYDAGKDFACKTWRWDAGEGAYSPEVTWTDTWQKICEAHNDDSTRQRHSFPFPDRAFRWMKESEHGEGAHKKGTLVASSVFFDELVDMRFLSF